MKALPIILIVAIASFAFAGDNSSQENLPPAPEGKTVGRFQLVTATVEYSLGDTEKPRQEFFRIDTATGQVWRFKRTLIQNTPGHPELKSTEVDGWIQASESFSQTVKDIRSISDLMNPK